MDEFIVQGLCVAGGFLAGSTIVGIIAYRQISRLAIDLSEARQGFATAEFLRAQDRYTRAGVMDRHPFAKPTLAERRERRAPPFIRRWFRHRHQQQP